MLIRPGPNGTPTSFDDRRNRDDNLVLLPPFYLEGVLRGIENEQSTRRLFAVYCKESDVVDGKNTEGYDEDLDTSLVFVSSIPALDTTFDIKS